MADDAPSSSKPPARDGGEDVSKGSPVDAAPRPKSTRDVTWRPSRPPLVVPPSIPPGSLSPPSIVPISVRPAPDDAPTGGSSDDASIPPSSRSSLEPGPASLTFSGLAIRRSESSVQHAYEGLKDDPLDPIAGENVTVRMASGELVPQSEARDDERVTRIDVPSIFWPGQLRFALRGVLGKGGTSRVFAAYDVDLERELAIKVVPRQEQGLKDQLAREASLTAQISHPNVPPIFDVGTVGEDYFLALPLIRGRSLRYRIRQAKKGGEVLALPAEELVQVLLKACDAVSYAHARGIIHKDLKPDNIMVGEYGEVMVVDWGSAAVLGERPDPRLAVGTPAYMAPEQAMGHAIDARADVFALGATLFHALLLRKPLGGGDATGTVKRRMVGEFDAPNAEELMGRPRALYAVAMRAMSFNPTDRYQTIADLAEALRAYLSGGDAWSEPIVDETFQEEGWSSRWVPDDPAHFARREHIEEPWASSSRPPARAPDRGPKANAPSEYVEWCLETTSERGGFFVCPEPFPPRVALDVQVCMVRGFSPGEITVVWTEDDVLTESGLSRRPARGKRTYCFRVGAMGNHVAGIFFDFERPLATRTHRLQRGRTARVRVEVDGVQLRLLVDGESIATHRLSEPLGPGRLGLFAASPGKRFAHVQVRERGTPGTVGALAIGDAFYGRRLYQEALEEYERVGVDPGDTRVVSELLYKRGLCLYQLGRTQAALDLWKDLSGPRWRARVAMHEAVTSFRDGQRASALRLLRDAATLGPEAVLMVRQTWARLVGDALRSDDGALEGFLQLRDDLFPDDPATQTMTARALLQMGEFERVLEEFVEERIERTEALLARGLFERVIFDVEVDEVVRDRAFIERGQLDEVSEAPASLARKLVLQGKTKEALEQSHGADVALSAGETERALMAVQPRRRERVTALVRAGRSKEALRLEHPLAYLAEGKTEQAQDQATSAEMRLQVTYYRAIHAFLEGRADELARLAKEAELLPFSLVWENVWFDRFFLLPLCQTLTDSSEAFSDSMKKVVRDFEGCFKKRAFFMAAHILGEIDDKTFLAQPAKGSAAGRLYLARALAAEWSGDEREAAPAYAVFNSLKPHHRFIDGAVLHPSVDLFCTRRAEALLR